MSRNYKALLSKSAKDLTNRPLPETPDEMVLWLRHHAEHVERDSSQDQCQGEYRLAADMMQTLLDNSTV